MEGGGRVHRAHATAQRAKLLVVPGLCAAVFVEPARLPRTLQQRRQL